MKPHTSVSRVVLARTCCALGTVLLSACGNLSGLDGSSKFSCKAPEGVHCTSVTANYANRTPADAGGMTRHDAAQARPTAQAPLPAIAPGADPVALRSPVRVLRLWVKAWEDSDRDLVDQSYVYVRVDEGHWQVAHVQRAAREAYAPLRPPAAPPQGHAGVSPGAAPLKAGTDLQHGNQVPLPAIEPPRP